MTDPQLVLGTHVYPAQGGAAERLHEALESWHTLGADLVNLQFADGPESPAAGFRSLRALTLDSNRVSGRPGARKPIVREAFDVLWTEARAAGAPYFGFSNADIRITPQALAELAAHGGDAHVFSRAEQPAGGAPGDILVAGQDTFFIATEFWGRHRHRFRRYILGEPVWDGVYTSILLTHGRTYLHNTGPLVVHRSHEIAWRASPFAAYAWMLGIRDGAYFERWCAYAEPVIRRREAGEHDPAWEEALLQRVFGGPIPLRRRAHFAARRAYWELWQLVHRAPVEPPGA